LRSQFRYGNKFVKRCKSYLHAEEEAVELLVSIESNWVKMETQIEILKRVAGGLNKRLQDMQSQVLSQLEGKLKTASLIIEQMLSEKREDEKAKKGKRKHDDRDIAAMMKGLGDMKTSKKAKYVSKRSALYQIIDEIEKWQARYDPTWILIMQMSIGNIDEELHEQQKKPEREQIPIIVAAKGVRDATRATHGEHFGEQGPIWIDHLDLKPSSIPYSPVQLSALKDEKETVLIDTMVCNPAANADKTAKEVRNLARILAKVDPSTFSLLRCRGVIKAANTRDSSPRRPPHLDFKFIFNIPPQLSNPQSLRTVLLSTTSYPLDERLDLAKRLASSILFVHTVQFVHKNIRPETIIIFQNEHSQIGAPFLAGFEQFRMEDGNTYRAGDDKWQRNLCKIPPNFSVIMLTSSLPDRHPSRQGTHPEVDYEMQHDIYSLGVVLLEIGLWTSFVLYGPVEESSSPVPNNILEPADLVPPRNSLCSASQNKLKLEDLAAKELPARLGRRYTDIVLLCLRCLDPGSGADQDGKGFGVDAADLTDEDGVTIGVRYIENVLEKMQEITL
jgi:serine/threonine protein kinase